MDCKPLTPFERAEKVIKYLANVLDTWPGHQEELVIQHEIAAEIQAAVEEAQSIGHIGEVVGRRLKEAKAEAYEDAAKMTHPYGDVGREIAKDIRARAKEK